MDNKDIQPLLYLTRGDRWVTALFMPLMIPVVGYGLWLVQKEETTSVIGWVVKWCFVEFFLAAVVMMAWVFLWAVFQAEWIARPLTGALRRMKLWLVFFLALTIIGNIVVWTLGKIFGWH